METIDTFDEDLKKCNELLDKIIHLTSLDPVEPRKENK